MIEIRDLRFRYPEGDFELSVPELQVEPGETVAIIGPSGCGKTTLLHLMAGIRTPQAGKVVTDDVEVTSLDDGGRRDFRIRRIGMVFQEFELLEYLTVLDNILLPYRINPSLKLGGKVRSRAERIAGQVGIADKLGRFATRLSHGEKQRVAVCRALVAEPVLLLADEPTGNLDPTNTERVMDILLDAAEAAGTTLVTVTHEHELLPRFDRSIDVMDLIWAPEKPQISADQKTNTSPQITQIDADQKTNTSPQITQIDADQKMKTSPQITQIDADKGRKK
jgi:ABC-type lipoprotein export system ATPase subunit